MAHKLCILVCRNLGREVAAVIKSEGFDDVTLATFPAHCNRPWLGWKDLEQITRARGENCSHYCLLSGCLATESQEMSPELKLCRHDETGSCFYLFLNSPVLDAYVKQGAYLLTPGWLARWRHYVDEWGFNQETAREFFGECVTKLLLLDTGVDERSAEHLREFADFVELDFEVLPVGLDFFRLVLTQVVQEWRLEREREKAATALTAANQQSADYAMVLDLIGNLTRIMTEPDVIENILELFTMLFAPRRLVYLPLIGDEPGQIQARPADVDDIQEMQNRLAEFQDDYAWTASGEGFLLRIAYRDETLGILEAEGVTFPEYKERYLNVALAVAQVCGLAINNARTFQAVQQTQEQLQRYAAELEKSNDQVRQFAYIVSHDLRAPLINLKGFVSELRSVLGGAQDALDPSLHHLGEKERQVVTAAFQEDVPEALDFIDSATSRMDSFINALLKLSRLGRQELHPEPVEMSALVQTALQTLAHQIEQHPAQVTVALLPEVVADRIALQQIVDNVLGNAVKYLAPGRPGEIEIMAERGENETVFCVRDNGRGISADDMPKVFAPFRRAGKQDVAGEGMGLAYVQTLLHRLGGRIWCESEPGVGSTFAFAIPHHLVTEADTV